MPDMDKVIKSLEICVNDSNVCGKLCEQCQYESDYHKHCHEILMADALALLKEQEAIIEQYHKADAFLDVHGWKWEGR